MISNGSMLDLNDTTTCDYSIEEVAHSLSSIVRFNGHTKKRYNVAQHCCIMSAVVPPEFALAALLHDMQEAFVSDLPTPVKDNVGGRYRELENRIQGEMADKFSIPLWKLNSHQVKEADLRILATERRDLFDDQTTTWPILKGVKPYNYEIKPLSRNKAKRLFLEMYHHFTSPPYNNL